MESYVEPEETQGRADAVVVLLRKSASVVTEYNLVKMQLNLLG